MYRPSLVEVSRDRLADLLRLSDTLHLRPGPGGSTASGRVITHELYRPALADLFPGRWVGAMVMALWPSSQLVAHRDPPIEGVRHHLPLAVNAGCWVFHSGTWQQLEVGQVYQMDPTQTHGAVNWGATLRLHLVIDSEE